MIDKSFQALILSLIIHGLLWLAYLRAPEAKKAPSLTSVDVVYNDLRRPTVIDNSDLKPKDTLERLKDQAKALSRVNRRVEEETVARPTNAPKVQNLAALTPKFEIKPPAENPSAGKKEGSQTDSIPITMPGLNPTTSGNKGENSFSKSVVIGGSTQGEWIPGVKEGSFSALNTDQFTYYTFFARTKEAIRFRWVQGVRHFSERASPSEILTLSRIPAPTRLEIVLSKSGDVLKISTMRTSGSADLDEAAIRAFWDASPLQNPPAEMADEDGLIRLYYAFQVTWHPQYMAQDRD